jgi:hypothetical protein
VSLKGASELVARVRAVKLTFKGYGKTWADETARQARTRVPVATGRLKASIRRRNATQKRATVVAHYSANFVDAGSKAHDIVPKTAKRLAFQSNGRTIFAKKVHKDRIGARPFKRASAQAALRKYPIKATMLKLWNEAA